MTPGVMISMGVEEMAVAGGRGGEGKEGVEGVLEVGVSGREG
jgi:hypothetical protein